MEILSIIQFLDFCDESKPIWQFLGQIVNIMQIAIPVIIILLGTLDLGKAVMAGDEKEIKSATTTLMKRVIAAVAVFLLFLIVTVVTGWVGGDEWKTCWRAADSNVVINPI